jgi:hypothetical protein
MNKEIYKEFKTAVCNLRRDLHEAVKTKSVIETKPYLKKVAAHICDLDQAARAAETESQLKERAQIVDFVLTTPWGAPFIGHSTLLDAARGFERSGKIECELTRLVSAFRAYEGHYHTQVFTVLEDVEEELKHEKI